VGGFELRHNRLWGKPEGRFPVYLIAAILTFSAAWLVSRDLRVRLSAPVPTP